MSLKRWKASVQQRDPEGPVLEWQPLGDIGAHILRLWSDPVLRHVEAEKVSVYANDRLAVRTMNNQVPCHVAVPAREIEEGLLGAADSTCKGQGHQVPWLAEPIAK